MHSKWFTEFILGGGYGFEWTTVLWLSLLEISANLWGLFPCWVCSSNQLKFLVIISHTDKRFTIITLFSLTVMNLPGHDTHRHFDTRWEVGAQSGGCSALSLYQGERETSFIECFCLLFTFFLEKRLAFSCCLYLYRVTQRWEERRFLGPWECKLKFDSPPTPEVIWRCVLLGEAGRWALCVSDNFSSQ